MRKTALLTLAMTLGCGGTDAGKEEKDATEQPLFVASRTIWPSSTIRVCWLNPAPEHDAAMYWTRAAVAESWEAVSAVRFVGWEPCAFRDAQIRIWIGDENPWAYLGTEGTWFKASMLLNFTFGNFSPRFCQQNIELCVRVIAVHEFGHALGFDHEQNRPDSPHWCASDARGRGDYMIGDWDLHSVMNYCNPSWIGHGALSWTDIAGVRHFYGYGGARGG